jgi:hypothetical protein
MKTVVRFVKRMTAFEIALALYILLKLMSNN